MHDELERVWLDAVGVYSSRRLTGWTEDNHKYQNSSTLAEFEHAHQE
jgi:hypothetical protein